MEQTALLRQVWKLVPSGNEFLNGTPPPALIEAMISLVGHAVGSPMTFVRYHAELIFGAALADKDRLPLGALRCRYKTW
jgi:hypothetical protein